jgi:hypothetical protein
MDYMTIGVYCSDGRYFVYSGICFNNNKSIAYREAISEEVALAMEKELLNLQFMRGAFGVLSFFMENNWAAFIVPKKELHSKLMEIAFK